MHATRPSVVVLLAVSWLTALAGCYAHVPHPGRVEVVEYERADRVEVALSDLRATSRARVEHWVTATAVRVAGVCEPVVVGVSTESGPVAGPVALVAAGVLVPLDRGDDGTFVAAADRFVLWANRDDAAIDVGTDLVPLHDEHRFNLRAFAGEIACAATADDGVRP